MLALALAAVVASAGAAAAPAVDPIGLEALRGRVVYVDFWASWCVPCRQSFPWMDELQRSLGKDGLVVVAVNVDHERKDAERFLHEFSPAFRIAYDPEGVLAEQYHVRGMPTSYLIDRDGKVQLQHAGFRPRDRDELAGRIRTLLAIH
jgi:thiol-disulfide isomerase/thioredoxin